MTDRLFPLTPEMRISGYYKRIGRRGVKMCREVLRRIEEKERDKHSRHR